MPNNRGFSAIEILLAVVITAVIATGGVSIYGRRHHEILPFNHTSSVQSINNKTTDKADQSLENSTTVSPSTESTPQQPNVSANTTFQQDPATIGTSQGIETITTQDSSTESSIVKSSDQANEQNVDSTNDPTINISGVVDESSL
ncbi:MAG: hypothetical protein NVS1B10_05090 [Candidatus Saccharimonadales bacterium]